MERYGTYDDVPVHAAAETIYISVSIKVVPTLLASYFKAIPLVHLFLCDGVAL